MGTAEVREAGAALVVGVFNHVLRVQHAEQSAGVMAFQGKNDFAFGICHTQSSSQRVRISGPASVMRMVFS